MYQLRLFGFGFRADDCAPYIEQPFVLHHQSRAELVRFVETQGPIMFAEGIAIPYEIWKCVGAVPVRLHEVGSIQGNATAPR